MTRPRCVPLCPASGLQVPLSYQRPGYEQASLEHVIRVGLDEPRRFGANYIDLYPSNKESAFPDREDYQHRMWPRYAFREQPDDDQQHRWTIDTFRQLNRAAHDRGYQVAWFLHHKFPYDTDDEWWSIMSAVHRELAEQICDVAPGGFGAHLDGRRAGRSPRGRDVRRGRAHPMGGRGAHRGNSPTAVGGRPA